MKTRIFTVIGLLFAGSTWAACPISTSSGQAAAARGDYLSRLFETLPKCPQNVMALKTAVQADGLRVRSHMVANRSFHNPSGGSFSFFESLHGDSPATRLTLGDGDFFFGHFTTRNDAGELSLDQTPPQSSLLIELIAWDATKGAFNFFELIGSASNARWFYRGDSFDILADNTFLHRPTNAGVPKFGDQLRCSACHVNGGPIIKEASMPHNDWWMPTRPLPLGPGGTDANVSALMPTLQSATELTKDVEAGSRKLLASPTYQSKLKSLSLQEQLRPLFCAQEMQFASDLAPLDEVSRQNIQVPVASLVDPRLITTHAVITVSKRLYTGSLVAIDSKFPEISRRDGDHAWLVPVKASTDAIIVDALVNSGLIDGEFVADVLAVDFANPALSTARCALLKLVPNQATENWKAELLAKLQATASGNSSDAKAAGELAANLSDPLKTALYHKENAQSFVANCAKKLSEASDLNTWMLLIDQRRREIRESEISKNPRGQILEPGFRVIFPEFRLVNPTKRWKLNASCDVVRAN